METDTKQPARYSVSKLRDYAQALDILAGYGPDIAAGMDAALCVVESGMAVERLAIEAQARREMDKIAMGKAIDGMRAALSKFGE